MKRSLGVSVLVAGVLAVLGCAEADTPVTALPPEVEHVVTPVGVLVIDEGYLPSSDPRLPPTVTDLSCGVSMSQYPAHGTAVMGVLWQNIPPSVPVDVYFAAIGNSGDINVLAARAACALNKVPANQIQVVNMSLDLGGVSGTAAGDLSEALSTASQSALLVTASGNGSGAIALPSTNPGVLVVGGTSDLSLPKKGLGIVKVAEQNTFVPTVVLIPNTGACDVQTNLCNGTSFAAPKVAAFAARARYANPMASSQTIGQWLMANASVPGGATLDAVGAGVINPGSVGQVISPFGSITINLLGSGSAGSLASRTQCPGLCTMYYLSGTSISIPAAAPAGSQVSWSGPCQLPAGTTCNVVATGGPQTVTATFALTSSIQVRARAGNSGSGTVLSTVPSQLGISCSISGASATGACSGLAVRNSSVTLIASPAPSFQPLWGAPCAGTTTTCTFTPTTQTPAPIDLGFTWTGSLSGGMNAWCTPAPFTCTGAWIKAIHASGSTIHITDGVGHDSTMTLVGFTASGGMTASQTCVNFICSDRVIVRIVASGHTLTIRDGTGKDSTITLVGANASGQFSAAPICDNFSCGPTRFAGIHGSGTAMSMRDAAGHTGTITFTQ